MNLYEYSIKESDFQEHFSEIETELNGPEIEGVYEMGVPLDFRILVNIGCLCTVSRAASRGKPKSGTDHFELNDLEFRSCSEELYMKENIIRKMFLFHISLDEKRQLFALLGMERKPFMIMLGVRIPTVKLKIPGKAFFKSGSQTSVTFKL